MKSLFALTLICIISLCSQALAQPGVTPAPAPAPAPAAQQNPQSSSSKRAHLPDTDHIVKPDNWDCTLNAVRYDWWRLEVVITTLSTYRLQKCSVDRMNRITVASASAQLKPIAVFDTVLKSGAQQMLMDVNLTPVVNEFYWVSDLKFSVMGETRLSLGELYRATKLGSNRNLSGANYRPYKMRGDMHFIWNAGTLVHRLVAPDGKPYIMFSYTTVIQETLTRDNLSNLEEVLKMPPGWIYENYFLDKTLVVRSGVDNDNMLTVLFDDVNNYYVFYNEQAD